MSDMPRHCQAVGAGPLSSRERSSHGQPAWVLLLGCTQDPCIGAAFSRRSRYSACKAAVCWARSPCHVQHRQPCEFPRGHLCSGMNYVKQALMAHTRAAAAGERNNDGGQQHDRPGRLRCIAWESSSPVGSTYLAFTCPALLLS